MNEIAIELAKQVPALMILLALCVLFFRFTAVIYERHKRDMMDLSDKLIRSEQALGEERKIAQEKLISVVERSTEVLVRVAERLKS